MLVILRIFLGTARSPAPISRSERSMSLKNRSNSAWANSAVLPPSPLQALEHQPMCSEIMSKRPVDRVGNTPARRRTPAAGIAPQWRDRRAYTASSRRVFLNRFNTISAVRQFRDSAVYRCGKGLGQDAASLPSSAPLTAKRVPPGRGRAISGQRSGKSNLMPLRTPSIPASSRSLPRWFWALRFRPARAA